MKKWQFWSVLCIISLVNGGCFFGASLTAMRRGVEGADNQASLLFIPVLWMLAAFVLAVLLAYTLIRGANIQKEQIISIFDVFQLSGLSGKAKAGRIAFMLTACLLMLLGFALFASETAWAAAYALSGGALLLGLYAWRSTALQK